MPPNSFPSGYRYAQWLLSLLKTVATSFFVKIVSEIMEYFDFLSVSHFMHYYENRTPKTDTDNELTKYYDLNIAHLICFNPLTTAN